MFGWGSKKPKLMDEYVRLVYGANPPKRRADVNSAVALACTSLLGDLVGSEEVQEVAAALYSGPIPYSTHDLALAAALNLYKSASLGRLEALSSVQLLARMEMLDWLKAGFVAPVFAKTFEDNLYHIFKR